MMSIVLNEKERAVIQDLQTQEKSCVEKYGKYAEQARDPELKNLFRNIQQEEQKHYESLSMILSGSVPECNCNDRSGRDYQPKAVYTAMSSPLSPKANTSSLYVPDTSFSVPIQSVARNASCSLSSGELIAV